MSLSAASITASAMNHLWAGAALEEAGEVCVWDIGV